MANDENIAAYRFTSDQSREEAAKNGRKGGIASGEAKRRKKALSDCLDALLEKDYSNSSGQTMSGAELISTRLFQLAANGDINAFRTIRDTIGQMPVQRVEVDTIDPQARAEMDKLLGLDE